MTTLEDCGGTAEQAAEESESRRFAASGAKALDLHDLRGAKAPLYHSAAGFRDFFRSL